MRGHMRQRGDAWELRVYVGRDPVTGQERYATRTIRAGKREAQRVLNEMVVAAERGSLAKTRVTFGELVEKWFEHAERSFSPKTVRETRGVHRPDDQAGARRRQPGAAPTDHSGPFLRPVAVSGWRAQWRSTVAGDGSPHPRHHPSDARAGRPVGVARHQPCGVRITAARLGTLDPTTDAGGARHIAGRGGTARSRAGHVSRALGRHRCPTERARGAAMVRHRSSAVGRHDRARHRAWPGRHRREGHEDASSPANHARSRDERRARAPSARQPASGPLSSVSCSTRPGLCSRATLAIRHGSLTRSAAGSGGSPAASGCPASDCTICATTWPLAYSRLASTSGQLRAGSVTGMPPPRSTCTRTSCPKPTAKPPTSSRISWRTSGGDVCVRRIVRTVLRCARRRRRGPGGGRGRWVPIGAAGHRYLPSWRRTTRGAGRHPARLPPGGGGRGSTGRLRRPSNHRNAAVRRTSGP